MVSIGDNFEFIGRIGQNLIVECSEERTMSEKKIIPIVDDATSNCAGSEPNALMEIGRAHV